MDMEASINMKPKGALEDMLSFLKSPRTLPNDKNWASYGLGKMGNFEEMYEENIDQTWKFSKLA